jgi:hypothetical protein
VLVVPLSAPGNDVREDGFPADMPVTIVVKHLLSVALPIGLHDNIPQLARQLYAMDGRRRCDAGEGR